MPIHDRLRDIETNVGGEAADTPAEIRVEWRDAAPEARPDGLEWDVADNRLAYDLWSAQRNVLEAVGDGSELVAFLAGYRAGKTVTGARWLLANACEELIEATVGCYEWLQSRGEASTDDLYRRYRGDVPGKLMDRRTFECRVVPVLAGAEGVDARLYRLHGSSALKGEAIDGAATEVSLRHEYGAELLAAMYRALLDAPAHGLTRLGLAHAGSNRANVGVTERFIGPVDPDDPDPDTLRRRGEGLSALLDMPGVEPPERPEWQFVENNA